MASGVAGHLGQHVEVTAWDLDQDLVMVLDVKDIHHILIHVVVEVALVCKTYFLPYVIVISVPVHFHWQWLHMGMKTHKGVKLSSCKQQINHDNQNSFWSLLSNVWKSHGIIPEDKNSSFIFLSCMYEWEEWKRIFASKQTCGRMWYAELPFLSLCDPTDYHSADKYRSLMHFLSLSNKGTLHVFAIAVWS